MITTIGIFSTHANAESALGELRALGVPEEDISYVYVNIDGELVDKQVGEKVEHGAGTGATTGAVLGAVLGFVVANGILPGLGSLIVAGPLAVALGFTGAAVATVGGAMTGAAAGGFIGALNGLGISDEDALRFQGYIKSGDVLVIVRLATSLPKEVFIRAHAREVQEYVQP